MHARLEHLLNLRDGAPVDAAVRAHVEGCAECTAALAQTSRVRARLRTLPSVPPDERGWTRVRERLATRGRTARTRARFDRAAVAASLAVIAAAVAWRVGDAPDTHDDVTAARLVAPLSAQEAVALDRVAQLRTQSAALEEALALLGERPAVQRAGTAMPIDTLEAQVQWIDHRISASGDALEAERLWRERVDAMNTLVRLRYVEAQPIAM
ncbi:MAG: hypothetical protein K0R70_1521 [Steroidobacteraceae bacterium]|nr:hypothetical protein [Steroidobacteraceae bacterium]